MEFFRIKRDIPFMRHALVFNVISLVTFLLAVVFLAMRGLNFGVDFRGGTVIEVAYSHAVDFNRLRGAIDKLQLGEYSGAGVRELGHGADPLPLKEGRVERPALRAGHGDAARGRSVGDAEARRVRRSAGRAASSTRTARWRCCSSSPASSAISRCASSGGSRSRRSLRTCTTSSSSWASSRSSSGSSRCRCWPRVLAVLGYSVNESVVIADRIRENFRKMRKATVEQVIDNAITAHDLAHDHHARPDADHGASILFFGGETLHYLLARADDRHPVRHLLVGAGHGAARTWLGVSREDLVKPERRRARRARRSCPRSDPQFRLAAGHPRRSPGMRVGPAFQCDDARHVAARARRDARPSRRRVRAAGSTRCCSRSSSRRPGSSSSPFLPGDSLLFIAGTVVATATPVSTST